MEHRFDFPDTPCAAWEHYWENMGKKVPNHVIEQALAECKEEAIRQNPGMDNEDVYFYFDLLARCLRKLDMVEKYWLLTTLDVFDLDIICHRYLSQQKKLKA